MGALPVPMLAPADRPRRLERLPWCSVIRFEVQGLRIGVRSNDRRLLDRLPPALPPGARVVASPAVDRLYSIWIGDPSGAGCRLYAEGRRIARAASPRAVLGMLESEIRQFVAARARDRIFVHAGAVGWRGRAILVPGSSRSGKTTLTAALVRAGASYFSDEFAPLDEQGFVHPFAKPLTIRGRGGCDLHARRCRAQDLGGREATEPLPVGLVAFADYRVGASWSPVALTPGGGVLRMLAHTVPARLRPEASVAALSRAVQHARLLEGSRGEADQTARRLIRALEEMLAAESISERGVA